MRLETLTGLRTRQFERLLKVVRERGGKRGGNAPGGGRLWCLPPAEQVGLVWVCFRTRHATSGP